MAKNNNLKIRVLNKWLDINKEDISNKNLYVSCGNQKDEEYEDYIIIPPKTSGLIPVGITFDIPEGYILKIELNEELIDNSIIYIGSTFAPDNMLNELGIMVYNGGKQIFKLEDLTMFAKFYFIKEDNIEIEFIEWS